VTGITGEGFPVINVEAYQTALLSGAIGAASLVEPARTRSRCPRQDGGGPRAIHCSSWCSGLPTDAHGSTPATATTRPTRRGGTRRGLRLIGLDSNISNDVHGDWIARNLRLWADEVAKPERIRDAARRPSPSRNLLDHSDFGGGRSPPTSELPALIEAAACGSCSAVTLIA
jgi:hypothetical protein